METGSPKCSKDSMEDLRRQLDVMMENEANLWHGMKGLQVVVASMRLCSLGEMQEQTASIQVRITKSIEQMIQLNKNKKKVMIEMRKRVQLGEPQMDRAAAFGEAEKSLGHIRRELERLEHEARKKSPPSFLSPPEAKKAKLEERTSKKNPGGVAVLEDMILGVENLTTLERGLSESIRGSLISLGRQRYGCAQREIEQGFCLYRVMESRSRERFLLDQMSQRIIDIATTNDQKIISLTAMVEMSENAGQLQKQTAEEEAKNVFRRAFMEMEEEEEEQQQQQQEIPPGLQNLYDHIRSMEKPVEEKRETVVDAV